MRLTLIACTSTDDACTVSHVKKQHHQEAQCRVHKADIAPASRLSYVVIVTHTHCHACAQPSQAAIRSHVHKYRCMYPQQVQHRLRCDRRKQTSRHEGGHAIAAAKMARNCISPRPWPSGRRARSAPLAAGVPCSKSSAIS